MIHGTIDVNGEEGTEAEPEAEDVLGNSSNDRDESRRPRRQTVKSTRLSDYEIYSDLAIDEEGSLIHIALMAEAEPVSVEEALRQPMWKNAMLEELKSIEKTVCGD